MAGGPHALTRLPGGTLALALVYGVSGLSRGAWAGSFLHRWRIANPAPRGLSDLVPVNPRPANLAHGRAILSGRFELGGSLLDTGTMGDPWDRPSPSLAFAKALHAMEWMPDLLAAGPEARSEALRLVLDWARVFGKWNSFSWGGRILSRRVYILACTLPEILVEAAHAERVQILYDFARQARHLASSIHKPRLAAEQSIAVALAGSILSGKVGAQLFKTGLRGLRKALATTIEPSGGHATRSPQAALELMFDLQTLAGVLHQKGLPPPGVMIQAMEDLHQTLQFFILKDGRLPEMQGSEAGRQAYVAAAEVEPPGPDLPSSRNGYQRLDGRGLQIMVDAAPPASGVWSEGACAQPLGLDVLAHSRRLIVACGWSPDALGPQALRLVDAGSTLSLGEGACGAPLSGFAAEAIGPWLESAYHQVDVRRHEAEGGIWLDMHHDGWAKRYHLRHERRLFLDLEADELRGEDRLTPLGDGAAAQASRRFIPYTLRFHLHPTVRASLARDGRSVVLQAGDAPVGWRLRSDAQDIAVEASVYFDGLRARRSQQVVLKGQARQDAGARVRWKLASDVTASPRMPPLVEES